MGMIVKKNVCLKKYFNIRVLNKLFLISQCVEQKKTRISAYYSLIECLSFRSIKIFKKILNFKNNREIKIKILKKIPYTYSINLLYRNAETAQLIYKAAPIYPPHTRTPS